MSAPTVLTRLGAFEATQHVDRLANLIELEASVLGIDAELSKLAIDVLDKVSDAVEQKAAANFPLVAGELPPALQKINDEKAEEAKKEAATFDPSVIAEKVPGPLESETDEPWMNGHFTQGDLYEMSEKFGGRLAALETQASALQAKINETVTSKAALDTEIKKAQYQHKASLEALAKSKTAAAPVVTAHGFNLYKI